MPENKIEFIIHRDSDNQQVALNSLSIEAASALKVLLENVTEIAKLNPEYADVKIQLLPGSAVVAIEGTGQQIASINANLDSVINHDTEDKDLVEKWRNIQSLFVANGLHYEVNVIRNGQRTEVLQRIKGSKPFRAKTVRKQSETRIIFLYGKLINVGGKSPNIHILDEHQIEHTIACSETQAKSANRYLYDTILLSAWEKVIRGAKSQFEFCDVYGNPDIFGDFKAFIEDFQNTNNQVEALKKIHYKCRSLLDAKDYLNFKKFARLFRHGSTDVNVLKTILIITQSFKEHDELGSIRQHLKDLFDEKMESY